MGHQRPRVVVVGLGPAGPDLTTIGARERLSSLDRWHLRTSRHPAASAWPDQPSFDDRYESADNFGEVYASIAETLVEEATTLGEVGYAVPGSPTVLERTVALLRADDRVAVELVAGMSFLDLVWSRLDIDPVESRVRLVDGHRFAVDAAGADGALLVAHCHDNDVLSDIKLAWDDDEPATAVVLQRLGLPDEAITPVEWADLDRAVVADHLTSVFIPAVDVPVAGALVDFAELVHTLRQRCPWDAQQSHQSLRRYVIEEAYEVAEAIDGLGRVGATPDLDAVEHLAEELGDLLFQVVFHATVAAEAGDFTLGDVAQGIHDKLRRRHPHVFADDPVSGGVDAVVTNWDAIKRAESGRTSVMDGIPSTLPAAMLADEVVHRADKAGVVGDAGVAAALAVLAVRRTASDASDADLVVAAAGVEDAVRAAERPPDADTPRSRTD